MPNPRTPVTLGFALGNLAFAAMILAAALIGWPVRSWIVELPSVLWAALLIVSAFGLVRATRWRLRALRLAATTGIALAVLVVGAVSAVTYPLLHDGLVGSRPTALIATVLALPYLFLYPGAQLLWVQRQLSLAPRSS